METRIVTRHPDPDKEGANISKEKYDIIKDAILEVLNDVVSVPDSALADKVNEKLNSEFDGDLEWYVEMVKLDLLARFMVEYTPGKTPKEIREREFY